MSATPDVRKKAWERELPRGFYTQLARAVGSSPSSARRWFLPPGHSDRRAIKDDAIKSYLAEVYDLQPNDFVVLGLSRRKRRARSAAVSSAASRKAAATRRRQREARA